MEEDGRIAIALQHLTLHALVTVGIATLARGCVHQNLSLGHSRCRVEEELATLQLEGAVRAVQVTAKLPVNFCLRRVEYYFYTPVLPVALRVRKLSSDYDQGCDDGSDRVAALAG